MTLLRLDQEQALEQLHRSVAVAGTSGTAGTIAFPDHRPLALREVGIGASKDCRCVAVRDRLAYVGITGGGIAVVDLADPAQPAVIGGIANPRCQPAAFAIVGSTMYVADHDAGLFVVDLTHPRKPRVVAAQPALAGTQNRRVLVAGALLVLINEHAFSVYDVSRAREPRPLAYHHRMRSGVGFFRGAALVGTQLLVTQGVLGVWVFDLANPVQPRALIGQSVALESRPHDKLIADSLALYDGRAFVGTSSGVWVLRLQDAAPPVSEAFFTGPGYLRDHTQGEARADQLHLGVFDPFDHAFYVFDVADTRARYLGRQRYSRIVDRIHGFQFTPHGTIAAAGHQGILLTSL